MTRDNPTGFAGSVLDAIGDAVVVVSRDGDIRYVNRRAEILLGYARDELIGRQVEVLVPEGLRDGHVRLRVGYVASPEPRPMGSGRELKAVRRDGSELTVEISLGVATGDGQPCVVCGLHHMTELRSREDRLHRVPRSVVLDRRHALPVQACLHVPDDHAGAGGDGFDPRTPRCSP